jgi:hypothetical protein
MGMGKTNLMEMICGNLISSEPRGLEWCKKCGRCQASGKYKNWGISGDESGAYIKEIQASRGLPGRLMTIWFNAWKYEQE